MSKPVVTAIAAILFLCTGAVANATEGELTLGLGAGFSDLPTQGDSGHGGFGGQLHAEYRFGLFWGAAAGASYTYQPSDAAQELRGQSIGAAWAGLLYNLDVATYVPYLTLGPAFYLSSPQLEDGDDSVDFGARLGLGLDWRRYRTWSLGGEIGVHAFATDIQTYPVYLTGMLRVSVHIDLF